MWRAYWREQTTLAIEFAFLETIAGRSALNPDAAPPTTLAEAVREHLILLFNTRQGSVRQLPDYGLPDLSEYYKGFPDSLEPLGRAIKDTVARYEPRLADVKVYLSSTAANHFEATFTIEGTLESLDEPETVIKFQTVVSGTGRTQVAM
ncbi:MAG: type VI secretion system baseplate subunit TssE [Deltaproteobacteria bacterium]|nr:type VI secretion system baseplate subunit TssE [Deltaproteobacteria bacterium]